MSHGLPGGAQGGCPGADRPLDSFSRQKVRVFLALRRMGATLKAEEEEFLQNHAPHELRKMSPGSQDQGPEDDVMVLTRPETEEEKK
ncbi:beta-catenin-interacting protein 1 [Petromyzon marinus]|uniref:beta-catenin-interacting protein 1 n=1 Tax=Petromyzon marinus TaxID=7757 RepID=UPI003F713614